MPIQTSDPTTGSADARDGTHFKHRCDRTGQPARADQGPLSSLRVGVIGPTAIAVTLSAAGLDPVLCERTAEEAGAGLARRGYSVVLVPDRGVALVAARAYRAAGGPRLIGLIPHGGTAAQNDRSCCENHRYLCHETVEDLAWTGQHERLCQLSDVLLCIGLSCGTIAEIAWTKWVGNRPVLVIRPLVSGIPPEIAVETDLRWVDDLDSAFTCLEALAALRADRATGPPGNPGLPMAC